MHGKKFDRIKRFFKNVHKIWWKKNYTKIKKFHKKKIISWYKYKIFIKKINSSKKIFIKLYLLSMDNNKSKQLISRSLLNLLFFSSFSHFLVPFVSHKKKFASLFSLHLFHMKNHISFCWLTVRPCICIWCGKQDQSHYKTMSLLLDIQQQKKTHNWRRYWMQTIHLTVKYNYWNNVEVLQ